MANMDNWKRVVQRKGAVSASLVSWLEAVVGRSGPLSLLMVGLLLVSTSGYAAETYTSTQLLEDPSYRFSRATTEETNVAYKRLPHGFSGSGYLVEPHYAWYYRKGDLVIDGNLNNSHALIIDGDLTIEGNYDDYTDDIGLLVVLGDLRVVDAYSWGSVSVMGKVRASGMFYAEYNDYVFDAGSVEAGALIIYDKSGSVGEVKAPVYISSWESSPDGMGVTVLRTVEPEILIPGMDEFLTEDYAFPMPSSRVFRQRLAAGLPAIRLEPGPPSLDEELLQVVKPDAEDRALFDAIPRDRLLAAVVARRSDLSAAIVDKLLDSRDPLILEMLALNPDSDAKRLDRIVDLAPQMTATVLEHPRASEALQKRSVDTATTEGRIRLAQRSNLGAELVSSLAADPDAEVRKHIIWEHGHRLSDEQVTRLAGDSSPEVKVALLDRRFVPLSAQQLSSMIQEESEEVRYALARRLARQATGKIPSTMALEERQQLAKRLLKDQSIRVRFTALASAEPEAQRAALNTWPEAEQRNRVVKLLANSTISLSLQQQFAAHPVPEIRQVLATNLALAKEVQIKLFEDVERATPQGFFQLFNSKTDDRARKSAEDVVADLLENPNVSPLVVEKAVAYCAEASGRAAFCYNLFHLGGLHSEHIEILKASYSGKLREELALDTLSSKTATRSQVIWALKQWYDDDEDVLGATERLESLGGEMFWRALASSKVDELREIAAVNAHTPVDSLSKLLAKDSDEGVVFPETNPSLSAEQLDEIIESGDEGVALLLRNPAIDVARVRKLLEKALARNDISLAGDCLEWLGIRELRGIHSSE